ncbi:MAG: GNAT family N-acetyltransferase [Tepidisphaeraceae bacterium]
MSSIEVVPLSDELVPVFRSVRLRALQTDPLAFGSTYATESVLTDSDWVAKARRWQNDRSCCFLALRGASPVGFAASFIDDGHAHLVSVWVAPDARRQQVGVRLIEAATAWARSLDLYRQVLAVTSVNEGAQRFYESLGFTATGRILPYPNDATLHEIEMARPLKP